MRQGPSGRRSRNRHHGGGQHTQHSAANSGNVGNPSSGSGNRQRTASSLRHQTFDSNCFDVRVRGNAWQVHEKYLALARDAQGSGERVSAENFLQHAEHYFRIIEAINEATALEQRQRSPSQAFNQQPEIPSGYYDSGQNASGATTSHSNESEINASIPNEQSNKSRDASSQISSQQGFRAGAIPPALSDPFFVQDTGEDSLEEVSVSSQR